MSAAHALRAEGLDAVVVGGLLAGFKVEHRVLARVLVPMRQEAAAHAVISEWSADAVVDWSLVDVGEREDGEPVEEQAGAGEGRGTRQRRRRGLGHSLERRLVVLSLVVPCVLVLSWPMAAWWRDWVGVSIGLVVTLWVFTASRVLGRE